MAKKEGLGDKLSKYEIYGKYSNYLETAGIKLPTEVWFVVSIIAGVAVGAIIGLLRLDFGILVGISIIDLMLGMPYFIARKRVNELEAFLKNFKAGDE